MLERKPHACWAGVCRGGPGDAGRDPCGEKSQVGTGHATAALTPALPPPSSHPPPRSRLKSTVVVGVGGPRYLDVYIPLIGKELRVQVSDLVAPGPSPRNVVGAWDKQDM